MDQGPIYLTKFALARVLKEFAQSLGLSDHMADAAAQVHLHTSHSANRWSNFIVNNCVGCRYQTTTCAFLNPRKEHCPPGAEPLEMKAANAMVIELGKLDSCPIRESEE